MTAPNANPIPEFHGPNGPSAGGKKRSEANHIIAALAPNQLPRRIVAFPIVRSVGFRPVNHPFRAAGRVRAVTASVTVAREVAYRNPIVEAPRDAAMTGSHTPAIRGGVPGAPGGLRIVVSLAASRPRRPGRHGAEGEVKGPGTRAPLELHQATVGLGGAVAQGGGVGVGGKVVLGVAQGHRRVAPSLRDRHQAPRLGVPRAARLPAVGRGRGDVHPRGQPLRGERPQHAAVGREPVPPGGQVAHGQHVAVQLVGDRHEAEVQGPERPKLSGRPSSRRSNSRCSGRRRGCHRAPVGGDDRRAGGVDRGRGDVRRRAQALEDGEGHRELAEVVEVDAVGGVQRSWASGCSAFHPDAVLDVAHRALTSMAPSPSEREMAMPSSHIFWR